MKRCVTCLMAWLKDSSNSIPGGGVLEMALFQVLETMEKRTDDHQFQYACQIAMAAVAAIPNSLVPYSRRLQLMHQVRLHHHREERTYGVVASSETGAWSVAKPAEAGVLEPLCSKYVQTHVIVMNDVCDRQQLFGSVLSTIAQLVRIDSV